MAGRGQDGASNSHDRWCLQLHSQRTHSHGARDSHDRRLPPPTGSSMEAFTCIGMHMCGVGRMCVCVYYTTCMYAHMWVPLNGGLEYMHACIERDRHTTCAGCARMLRTRPHVKYACTLVPRSMHACMCLSLARCFTREGLLLN